MDRFVPYSGQHFLTVAVCLGVIAATAAIGQNAGEHGEQAWRRSLAFFALCVWVVYNVSWNWHGIDIYEGLPLQVCDLAGLIAPLALLTLNRWLRATLYFWTFALTAQAFIQPTVTAGLSHPLFWAFWIAHTVIGACAVYDLAVLQFRPAWSDLMRTYFVSAVYLAVVVAVNQLIGSNYGYIGNPPPERAIPPFVAALGPWPQRAIVVVALAAIAFALALVPWLRASGRRLTTRATNL